MALHERQHLVTQHRGAAARKPAEPSRSLAGCSIVITRPAGTGGPLAAAVRMRGGFTITLPGLALRAKTLSAHQVRALAQADIWIFSSPSAVRFAFHAETELRLHRGAFACAIGEGTARALARHGIRALAPTTRRDSEGLLELPELADVRGARVALIGAAGGRGLIAPSLRARGATVEEIDVYERVEARLTRRHLDALAHARDPLVMLVSSGEALANLLARLPAEVCARLRAQTIVVSSERLAALAATHGFGRIVRAASALPRDLLDAAAAAVADGAPRSDRARL